MFGNAKVLINYALPSYGTFLSAEISYTELTTTSMTDRMLTDKHLAKLVSFISAVKKFTHSVERDPIITREFSSPEC